VDVFEAENHSQSVHRECRCYAWVNAPLAGLKGAENAVVFKVILVSTGSMVIITS
jgi:hypothetical protein